MRVHKRIVIFTTSGRYAVIGVILGLAYVLACLLLTMLFVRSRSIGTAQAVSSEITLPGTTPTAVRVAIPTITPQPTRTRVAVVVPPTPRQPATPTRPAIKTPPVIAPTPFPSRPLDTAGIHVNLVEHFILDRPVPPDADSNRPDRYYLYGTTEQGTLEVHHGVEFVNPVGTPLLAVGNGIIVVAGSDDQPHCGADGHTLCGPFPNFYGNLVVLQLDTTYHNQAIFVVYGHMDTITAHLGDRVSPGQTLGTVGMTGVAQGPHVHFEVRTGVNDYAHTRDPLLWLKPLSGSGMLAGLAVDANGNPLSGAEVDLLDASGQEIQFSETYGHDDAPNVNGDDDAHENFVLGDLSAGPYQVRIIWNGKQSTQSITIDPGHLAFVILRIG